MLLHELFAKIHDAKITKPSFLRISIGYRCVAELNTRLPSSATKPSNYNNLRILLVYSRHTVTCPEVISVKTTYILTTQSSSTNIAARRFSPFGKSSFICTHC